MAKIKRLIIEDFGGIVGRHKIDFLRKRKKLTIIRGDMAYGFATNGPFHLSTLISAAIKNALGKIWISTHWLLYIGFKQVLFLLRVFPLYWTSNAYLLCLNEST